MIISTFGIVGRVGAMSSYRKVIRFVAALSPTAVEIKDWYIVSEDAPHSTPFSFHSPQSRVSPGNLPM